MPISSTTRIIFLTSYNIVFLAGIGGNVSLFLVIATMKNDHRLMPLSLVANLSIADFLVCFLLAPYFITGLSIVNPPKPNDASRMDAICKGYIFLSYQFGFARILLLSVISLERFIAILYPFFYNKYDFASWSRKKIVILVCYLWFQAGVSMLPAIISDGTVNYKGRSESLCQFVWDSGNKFYIMPVFALNFFIPSIIILYTNCRVYSTARKQKNRIRACSVTVEQRQNTINNDVSKGGITDAVYAISCNNEQILKHSRRFSISACLTEQDATHSVFPDGASINPICDDKSNMLTANYKRRSIGDNPKQSNELPDGPRKVIHIAGKLRKPKKDNANDYVAFISTLCVVTIFFITWLPFVITAMIELILQRSLSIEVDLFTSALTIFDSALTPFVVFGTRRNLRKQFRKLIKKCKVF